MKKKRVETSILFIHYFQASNNTQHNPEYVYDNKIAIQSEDIVDRGEINSPSTYYNLSDRDLKEGNGRVAGASTSSGEVDPVSINRN